VTAMKTNQSSRFLRLFLGFVLGIALVMGLLMAIVYRYELHSAMAAMSERERYEVTLMEQVVDEVFERVVSDLRFLIRQNELIAQLTGPDEQRGAMAAEYLAFATVKPIYDQIRFLDAQGREQVRVNFNAGLPSVVPDDALQDKSRRYYFTDVISLEPGQIFVSPFDLNVERGAVEQPLKPMIRIGTPVLDVSGDKRGIVLLNFLGQDLLERLTEVSGAGSGDVMLLNQDGYWLLAPDPEDAWGFMLPSRSDRNFARRYPEAWAEIKARGTGTLRTEHGLFAFAVVRPLDDSYTSSTGATEAFAPSAGQVGSDAYAWVLVSHVPQSVLDEQSASILNRILLLGGSAFALMTFGAWFLALAITRRRLYQQQLMTLAHYDSLTDLPNRTLFFDRLAFVHRNAARYGRSYGVLYIDLDGFKDVNDSLGHEAGDAVLIEVAARLRAAVRESDTAARLGGDELAVILSEIGGIDAAITAGTKLIDCIRAPIALPDGTAKVGASIGAAIYPTHGATSEAVLAAADRAMYVAKSRGKGECVAAEPLSAEDAEALPPGTDRG
jgi:diguanylate cyclase (GGDEF)-like protein